MVVVAVAVVVVGTSSSSAAAAALRSRMRAGWPFHSNPNPLFPPKKGWCRDCLVYDLIYRCWFWQVGFPCLFDACAVLSCLVLSCFVGNIGIWDRQQGIYCVVVLWNDVTE